MDSHKATFGFLLPAAIQTLHANNPKRGYHTFSKDKKQMPFRPCQKLKTLRKI